MKPFSTRVHGILDYTIGILLVLAPVVFDLDTNTAEGRTPILVGVLSLLYSLMTDYELGLVRLLPMRLHLMLDLLVSGILFFSPWLFRFNERIWLPHALLGVLGMGVALMTDGNRRSVAQPPAS
ncbi:MAG: hypothetical protein SFY81_03635 [Verrucomicrobiota bacterium]|nr:hypothetical protein [Verrucomicrobiota bacterium]